jgi:hypothetical protein
LGSPSVLSANILYKMHYRAGLVGGEYLAYRRRQGWIYPPGHAVIKHLIGQALLFAFCFGFGGVFNMDGWWTGVKRRFGEMDGRWEVAKMHTSLIPSIIHLKSYGVIPLSGLSGWE